MRILNRRSMFVFIAAVFSVVRCGVNAVCENFSPVIILPGWVLNFVRAVDVTKQMSLFLNKKLTFHAPKFFIEKFLGYNIVKHQPAMFYTLPGERLSPM